MTIKTATITFHRAYNYGSALQAYALQRIQEMNGVENKVIDYIYEHDMRNYRLFRKHYYKGKPWLVVKDLFDLPRNYSRKRSYENFLKNHISTTAKTFTHNDDIKSLVNEFDSFICGSDQIWNASCTQGVVPAFLLAFAHGSGKKTLSYAPSIGHGTVDEVYQPDFQKYLKGIDVISVRESSSVPAIQALTEKKVSNVIDPTLLLDPVDYEPIIKKLPLPADYIFFYALESNDEMVSYVSKIATQQKLPVVYFCRKNIHFLHGGINIFPHGPGEFLFALKNGKFVITNSFHATVFSVLYEKKFATFTTKKSGSRMVDFLTTLGLQKRLVTQLTDITESVNYTEAKTVLAEERKRSVAFLMDTLRGIGV